MGAVGGPTSMQDTNPHGHITGYRNAPPISTNSPREYHFFTAGGGLPASAALRRSVIVDDAGIFRAGYAGTAAPPAPIAVAAPGIIRGCTPA